MTIGSHVYAIENGVIVLEYANRNPHGVEVLQPAASFIEATITRVHNTMRENQQRARAIAAHEREKEARRKAAKRRAEAEKQAREKRKEQEKERISKRAKALGVSEYASFETKKEAVKEHDKKEQERNHAAFLARRAKWSYGTSDNCSGYRIGSTSDPNEARRILQAEEERRKREPGKALRGREATEYNAAYRTVHGYTYEHEDGYTVTHSGCGLR